MCPLFKKSFKQPDALKMHLHTHTRGRPFTCGFVENLSSILDLGGAPAHLYSVVAVYM
jgi:hypothetical protein